MDKIGTVEIKMPRIGTNDDYVNLAQWMVRNGETVKKGQVIAVLETTKETSDLVAPAEGYIELSAVQGEDIVVGQTVAYIHDTLSRFERLQERKEGSGRERKYSDKALRLIQEYHIDVSLLPGDRIIREKDVRKLVGLPYDIGQTDRNKVLIYGGGGFCRVVLDILGQGGEYRAAGILDRKYPKAEMVKGIPVIGGSDLESLRTLYRKGYRKIVNAVGFDGKRHARKLPYEMMKQVGYECINVIHRKAVLEPDVRMGEGNLIAAGAIIGSDVRIGNNCIINAGAVISHECVISDNCHIASGAVLGGNVTVGENTLIGQGCTVFRDIRIGAGVVVHNGADVTRDVPDYICVESQRCRYG